jgi:hypothetical protein
LLTTSDLEGWKKAIGGMPTCREFHEGAIEASPTCPFCKFRPSQRVLTAPASATLATLEQRLTPTLENWRKSLKANLESDSAQSSLANMPNERGPVDAFLMQADNDPDIPAGFVKAATTALRGLSALPLTVEDLVDALKAGGLPCTVEEFKQRFNQFVQARMRGHDPNGTRLTLEQPVTDVLIQSVDSESVKA